MARRALSLPGPSWRGCLTVNQDVRGSKPRGRATS